MQLRLSPDMNAASVRTVAESYQTFNPRAYLQNNYMPPRANFTSEEFVVPWKLRCLADTFATGEICGHTLIDIGTGPTIYQLLSACNYFEEIVATDYLEVNRTEIQKWVLGEDPDGFDWSPYIQHVCKIEGKGEPWKEKEQKLKKKLKKILPIDVHQPNPLGSLLSQPADALVSTFCLEAVSPNRPSFDQALQNVTTLLKPNGHFLMIGALEESFYLAGEARLCVVPVSEADVKESFAKSGYRIHNFRSYIMPPSLKIGVDDVQGVFFIHAQKSA
ncbi:phenylethanolamine N-methyltransferase [Hemicordylus capensis]|uniref:phenylethanolamine N-methyltransferase n=1 Tax=Hemicordylus capensis TaxID=884348 RepID=UPI002304BFCC|nr:phenylethanolamine N-methyltransferase [Hemicordylus capensis]XP_053120006.1 phenylethanolamine N-methyltransferase [Hemicordylus capensis]XP_053120007.1 phenylethanolamine N-methyltransferase [Hemicordylus capensis]XP_053120008.1 phenylethanolamine N-methyltransferase [Hemicordylus capensis]XP_053120009.1 phenylethanolamine N-methyltransferase [Hemicordylus capensis]XP_053120010.1 phenylethanolamine N-methyltransferase [Hemicordylus capensis]